MATTHSHNAFRWLAFGNLKTLTVSVTLLLLAAGRSVAFHGESVPPGLSVTSTGLGSNDLQCDPHIAGYKVTAKYHRDRYIVDWKLLADELKKSTNKDSITWRLNIKYKDRNDSGVTRFHEQEMVDETSIFVEFGRDIVKEENWFVVNNKWYKLPEEYDVLYFSVGDVEDWGSTVRAVNPGSRGTAETPSYSPIGDCLMPSGYY